MKTVRDVTGKNKTLTPNAIPKDTKKLTRSSFGRYQTGKLSGKKYPMVNPTFVTIAYITTLNINLGYLYKSAPYSIVPNRAKRINGKNTEKEKGRFYRGGTRII
jgi:hypothetical protein